MTQRVAKNPNAMVGKLQPEPVGVECCEEMSDLEVIIDDQFRILNRIGYIEDRLSHIRYKLIGACNEKVPQPETKGDDILLDKMRIITSRSFDKLNSIEEILSHLERVI